MSKLPRSQILHIVALKKILGLNKRQKVENHGAEEALQCEWSQIPSENRQFSSAFKWQMRENLTSRSQNLVACGSVSFVPPEFNFSSVGGTENVRRRNHSQEKSLQLPVISVTRFSDCSLPLLSALHPSSPLDLNHSVNKNEEFLSKLNHRHHEISTNSGLFVERRLTPTWLLPHHDHAASLEMNSSYDFTSCFCFVFVFRSVNTVQTHPPLPQTREEN